jgi:hypothetical protein
MEFEKLALTPALSPRRGCTTISEVEGESPAASGRARNAAKANRLAERFLRAPWRRGLG